VKTQLILGQWVQGGTNPNGAYVYCLAVGGTDIFSGTNGNGSSSVMYRSTNNGAIWTQVSSGMPNSAFLSITVTGADIYAGTFEAGVWRRPLSEFMTDITKEVNIIPQKFTLSQNFPNPFNPSTVIKYAVSCESNVNISFYNSLGQFVREVSEGNRQPGNYEINFNSSGLASGIYFYSIKAISTNGKNDFSSSKKMILLK